MRIWLEPAALVTGSIDPRASYKKTPANLRSPSLVINIPIALLWLQGRYKVGLGYGVAIGADGNFRLVPSRFWVGIRRLLSNCVSFHLHSGKDAYVFRGGDAWIPVQCESSVRWRRRTHVPRKARVTMIAISTYCSYRCLYRWHSNF